MVIRIGGPASFMLIVFYVLFRFFPRSIQFNDDESQSILERYQKQWPSNFSWTNLTRVQWEYALKIAPKLFRNFAAASCLTTAILYIFCPDMNKIVAAVIFGFLLFYPPFSLVRSARRYNR